ncbi:NAD(P)/FAD-dependent oxidoreductase [Fulvivirgaceae bacterium BMA10]|uniref:NAD(P)/FAD-dependent oxidoreductase n=1 Tax=Splendidivirga corallicola TaxID=3051826 RepID=A0ABT8KNZ4_9BACT|nr:NAD(P)/FAD-dependent oxidoreductase [Fulvivirgaceae bacterium BMA10]
MKDVIIIGGGLAGLFNAIQLARADLDVLVIEKKAYPFHRVCGEYISNEVVPFLKELEVYPVEFQPPQIDRFMLSSPKGNILETELDLGGFGISRFSYDHYLYNEAKSSGAIFRLNSQVKDINYIGNCFDVILSDGEALKTKLVVGAFGKRSILDKSLRRSFIEKRSPYIAVKYHIKTDFPSNKIALHNFSGGYCGLSKVENETYNLCYLSNRSNLKKYGKIEALEEEVLFKNPFLKSIFKDSDFLFTRPEVINEISFEKKKTVEDHILMSGDSAGLITPLCGNGMAMAIHSTKILSEYIIQFFNHHNFTRTELENAYSGQWRRLFSRRLWVGRKTQKLFGHNFSSEMSVRILRNFEWITKLIVRNTHGDPF